MKSTSDGLLVEILTLKKQISDLGIDKIVDLDEYFVLQKQNLMDAIEQLEKELQHIDIPDDHVPPPEFDDDIWALMR